MSADPDETARALRKEAATILADGGLEVLLRVYGRVVVHGSYGLDLMVWRDLDIYLCVETFQLNAFFEMGAEIAASLSPHRMHFRNELSTPSEGLPRGLYWGMYLRDQPYGPWKIDIWAVDAVELARLNKYYDHLAQSLTPVSRRAILEIKASVHNHAEYRRGFGAKDIYDAVLDAGVQNVNGFIAYLKEKMGLDIAT